MVHERTLDIESGSIRYLEAGAGWPVVLLHAFPLTADMWRPQLERVPDGWHFVAPDLAGLGGSARLVSPASMAGYAAVVAAMLDRLEIERAVIGGLSMGGYVTFELFRRDPDRFSGFVFADTRAAADTPEGREGRRRMSELVRTKGPAAVADEMIPKLLSDASLRERNLDAVVRRMILANDIEGIDDAIEALRERPDSTADLPRVSGPALIVVGEDDRLTPVTESELLHREIVRSQLVVLPGVGHLSSLEAPAEFSVALENFLTSNM